MIAHLGLCTINTLCLCVRYDAVCYIYIEWKVNKVFLTLSLDLLCAEYVDLTTKPVTDKLNVSAMYSSSVFLILKKHIYS